LTSADAKSSDNPRWGVLLAIFGYGIFSCQDAIVKWLVMHDYLIFQILFVRSVTITAISLGVGGKSGMLAVARSRNKAGLGLRAALMLGAWLCYYNAARQLPLPDLVTLYYAAPIIVTVMSIFILRETVGFWRWSSVIVGFVGVAIAANPTGRPELWPALLVLVAATFWAIATILVRKIMHAEPTINQMIFTNGAFALFCGALMPWLWQQPSTFELALMVGLGLLSGTGQYLLYESFRHAPASVIAPTEYTALVWAVILGYLIWQDLPTQTGIVGAVLIVASSLIVMVGERKRAG
jgi:drug/metabolite transporter (DMT)-like permease